MLCDCGGARVGVGGGGDADLMVTASFSLALSGPVCAGEGRARAVDQTDQRVGNAGPRARGTGDRLVAYQ